MGKDSHDIQDLKDFFTSDMAKEAQEEWRVDPSLLLHPNLPKPLHGLAPRTILGKTWWDKTRRKCYKDAGYRCESCGIQAAWNIDRNIFDFSPYYNGLLKLHAHEDYHIDYDKKEAVLNKIVCLCPTCHNYIHSGRTQALYGNGILDEEDCWEIMTNGDSI